MSISVLCNLVASGAPAERVGRYCERHPSLVNGYHEDSGYTPLILAVIFDRLEIASVLLDCNADINQCSASHDQPRLPPLYFALGQTRDELTRFLLARGANIHLIPPEHMPSNLGISHQYWLDKARARPPITELKRQHLQEMHLTRLAQVFMSVVGQDMAIQLIEKAIIAWRGRDSQKPLVLLFAGPPGHGKTVLGERLGSCLVPRGDYLKVDSTQSGDQYSMFGAAKPYLGAVEGAPLNNFMVNHANRPCVVLFDEIEKTGQDVRNALLNPFDKGEWLDRRHSKTVDCKQAIFILTTNALDSTIIHHFKINATQRGGTMTETQRDHFCEQLEHQATQVFDGPFARRISKIIPFVPFTKQQLSVLADQKMRDVLVEMIMPPSSKQKFGQIQLHYTDQVVQVLSGVQTDEHGVDALTRIIDEKIVQEVMVMYFDTKLKSIDDDTKKSDDTTSTSSNINNPTAPVWRHVTGFYSQKPAKFAVWIDERQQHLKVFPAEPHTQQPHPHLHPHPHGHAQPQPSAAASSDKPSGDYKLGSAPQAEMESDPDAGSGTGTGAGASGGTDIDGGVGTADGSEADPEKAANGKDEDEDEGVNIDLSWVKIGQQP